MTWCSVVDCYNHIEKWFHVYLRGRSGKAKIIVESVCFSDNMVAIYLTIWGQNPNCHNKSCFRRMENYILHHQTLDLLLSHTFPQNSALNSRVPVKISCTQTWATRHASETLEGAHNPKSSGTGRSWHALTFTFVLYPRVWSVGMVTNTILLIT